MVLLVVDLLKAQQLSMFGHIGDVPAKPATSKSKQAVTVKEHIRHTDHGAVVVPEHQRVVMVASPTPTNLPKPASAPEPTKPDVRDAIRATMVEAREVHGHPKTPPKHKERLERAAIPEAALKPHSAGGPAMSNHAQLEGAHQRLKEAIADAKVAQTAPPIDPVEVDKARALYERMGDLEEQVMGRAEAGRRGGPRAELEAVSKQFRALHDDLQQAGMKAAVSRPGDPDYVAAHDPKRHEPSFSGQAPKPPTPEEIEAKHAKEWQEDTARRHAELMARHRATLAKEPDAAFGRFKVAQNPEGKWSTYTDAPHGKQWGRVASPDRAQIEAHAKGLADGEQKAKDEIDRGGPLPDRVAVTAEVSKVRQADTGTHPPSWHWSGAHITEGLRKQWEKDTKAALRHRRDQLAKWQPRAKAALDNFERLERAGQWHPSQGSPGEIREKLKSIVDAKPPGDINAETKAHIERESDAALTRHLKFEREFRR